MVYKFATGSGFGGDAESTFNEMERIREENEGRLQTHDIVDAARPSSSVLHPHFEWDDHKAAEEHRKNTARKLVRAVIVQPEKNNGVTTPSYRQYISVVGRQDDVNEGEAKGRYYQNIEYATKSEFESALDNFHNKLGQLQHAISQIEMYAKNEEQTKIASQLREYSRQMKELAPVNPQ